MKLGFIGTGNMAGAKKESFLQKRSLDQILWKREEIM